MTMTNLQPFSPWLSMLPLAPCSPFYCFDPKLAFCVRTPHVTCSANSSDCPAQFKLAYLANKQTCKYELNRASIYNNLLENKTYILRPQSGAPSNFHHLSNFDRAFRYYQLPNINTNSLFPFFSYAPVHMSSSATLGNCSIRVEFCFLAQIKIYQPLNRHSS